MNGKKVEMEMRCVVLAAKYTYRCVALRNSNLTKEDVAILAQSIIGNVEQGNDHRVGQKIPVKYEDLPGFVRNYSHESTTDHEPQCVVKVILETCLLSEGEIALACQAAVRSSCDFVKTSTGFSTSGATAKHVSLMRTTVDTETKKCGWKANTVKVKASGGIRTAAEAKAMIEAGADRIGASKGVDIVKEALEMQNKSK